MLTAHQPVPSSVSIQNLAFAASLSFINPLPWPHRIVKSPSDVHFRISPEIVGHLDIFHLLFLGY